MTSKDEITEQLAQVRAPDGRDIVSAGLVSDIVVTDGRVAFAITVPAADAKQFEPVRAEAERIVKAIPGVERAMVVLTAEATAGSGHGLRTAPGSGPRTTPGGGGLRTTPGGAARGEPPAGRGMPPQAGRSMPPQAGRSVPPQAGRGAGPSGATARPGAGQPQQPQQPHQQQQRGGPVPGIARIVAIGSGKGGVGKSTTAVNVAAAMRALGWRVGILDADVYGPSVPTLVGLAGERPESADGRVIAPLSAHGLKVMSIGFLVAADAAIVWRGPMVSSALNQLLREVAWGADGGLDCLIIDMPPGTGDVQLSLAQQAPLTGAVIVCTPQDLALIDARRAIAMFGKVNVPVLGLIENMSHYICPSCGARADIFASGGGRAEAERSGLAFLGDVPLDIAIREGSDAGAPIVSERPDSPQAAAYFGIAAALMRELEAADLRRKPFPKIVIEDEVTT
jgi:ATP-binding protein involved in chromosome partitioning